MTEEKTVIDILIRRRIDLVEEIRKIDVALDALGHRGPRHPEATPARPELLPEPVKRYGRRSHQLAIKDLAPTTADPRFSQTSRGTARIAYAKGSLDAAVVAFLRAHQAEPYVRLSEIAASLESQLRLAGRSDHAWNEAIGRVLRRLEREHRIRRVAGVKGGYTVLRRSPGVEVPSVAAMRRANRKPRTSKAPDAVEREKSPSDKATS